MIYTSFAQLYDELFDSEMYQQWADFVMATKQDNEKTVLDLAGGAGRLAVLLAQKNLTVTVADFSDEMLSLADQHREKANVNLDLVNANMLDLSDLGQFDLVTCFADSLCYLDDLSQITTVFAQVYEHLGDNGRFLFDVISPYQTDVVYPGYMYNFDDSEQKRAFLWSSFANETVEHAVIHELSFFNWNDSIHGYDRVSETHYERTYDLTDYQAALKQVGFKQINVSADFGKQTVNDQTTRWFFECQK